MRYATDCQTNKQQIELWRKNVVKDRPLPFFFFFFFFAAF